VEVEVEVEYEYSTWRDLLDLGNAITFEWSLYPWVYMGLSVSVWKKGRDDSRFFHHFLC
jgi:hypothetical protein